MTDELEIYTSEVEMLRAENARLTRIVDGLMEGSRWLMERGFGEDAPREHATATTAEERTVRLLERLLAAHTVTPDEFPAITLMRHPDGDVRAAVNRRNGWAATRPSLAEAVERLAEMAGEVGVDEPKGGA